MRPLVACVLLAMMGCGGGDASAPGDRAASMLVVEGAEQSATVGSELPVSVAVQVLDAEARSVGGGQLVNFVVVSGGGSVFAGAATTNASGEVRERWTLGTTAGVQVLEARAVDQDTGEPITFTRIEATATPGPADRMVFFNGMSLNPEPQYTQFVGQNIDLATEVAVYDAFGNMIENPPIVITRGPTLTGEGLVVSANAETLDTVVVQSGDVSTRMRVAFLSDLRAHQWRLTAKCRGKKNPLGADSAAFDATTDSVTMGVLPGPGYLGGTVNFWLSGTTTVWQPDGDADVLPSLPSTYFFTHQSRISASQRVGVLEPGAFRGTFVSNGLTPPTYQGADVCQSLNFTEFEPARLDPVP